MQSVRLDWSCRPQSLLNHPLLQCTPTLLRVVFGDWPHLIKSLFYSRAHTVHGHPVLYSAGRKRNWDLRQTLAHNKRPSCLVLSKVLRVTVSALHNCGVCGRAWRTGERRCRRFVQKVCSCEAASSWILLKNKCARNTSVSGNIHLKNDVLSILTENLHTDYFNSLPFVATTCSMVLEMEHIACY